MTNKLNGMFAEASVTKGKKALSGTAELMKAADKVVSQIMDELSNDFDANAELFENSKSEVGSLDELINKFTNNFEDVDVDFLDKYDDAELKQMMKSQQSKRSRAKSKDMTMDNYTSMMNAAVSEFMIRKATGKSKTRTIGRGLDMYTIEYIESLGEDQHDLRREIRNVQSKICIYKKNHEDYEDHDDYKELLRIEGMLKDMRTPIEGRTKMADVAQELKVDLNGLAPEEALALLTKLQGMVIGGDNNGK